MKNALLNRIKELEADLIDLRHDLDAIDHTHYDKHKRIIKEIQDKSKEIEQIKSLINFEELQTTVLI